MFVFEIWETSDQTIRKADMLFLSKSLHYCLNLVDLKGLFLWIRSFMLTQGFLNLQWFFVMVKFVTEKITGS